MDGCAIYLYRMSMNIKKAVASGMRFQVAGNPDCIFKVQRHGDDDLNLFANGHMMGHVTFRYKHMVITDLDASGLVFTAGVKLMDVNFIDPM